MTTDMVKKLCENYMNKNEGSKIMVKAFTSNGWIQLKGYNQESDFILNEEDYLQGREGSTVPLIYKTTFSILT
jgi:hypothetical protein